MARYCFYCGRALANGEKCNCRSHGNPARPAATGKAQDAHGNATDTSTEQAGAARKPDSESTSRSSPGDDASRHAPPRRPYESAGSSDSRKQTAGDRPSGSGSTARASSSSKSERNSTGNPRGDTGSGWQARASHSARRNLSGSALRLLLRQLGRYLIHPADSVKLAAQSVTQQPVLIVLLLQGIAGGLFLLMVTRQPIMQALFALNISPVPQTANFLSRVFIFVQGFGISLGASLLAVLLYQVTLRYLFRRPASFHQLLAAMCPSFLFTALFLLVALVTLNASVFNAAMLILIGFAIAALLQFLALRQISGLDDNRLFTLIIFVLILFTGIMAMLFNLSLPVLRVLVDQSVTV